MTRNLFDVSITHGAYVSIKSKLKGMTHLVTSIPSTLIFPTTFFTFKGHDCSVLPVPSRPIGCAPRGCSKSLCSLFDKITGRNLHLDLKTSIQTKVHCISGYWSPDIATYKRIKGRIADTGIVSDIVI